ncbi:MAG: hypothetical protein AVDCRST_MAG76-2379, partial [uncultured Acidimicrobiales bacterium]
GRHRVDQAPASNVAGALHRSGAVGQRAGALGHRTGAALRHRARRSRRARQPYPWLRAPGCREPTASARRSVV